MKDFVVSVAFSNSIYKLVKISNIAFNSTIDCIPNHNSDCILDIGEYLNFFFLFTRLKCIFMCVNMYIFRFDKFYYIKRKLFIDILHN